MNLRLSILTYCRNEMWIGGVKFDNESHAK